MKAEIVGWKKDTLEVAFKLPDDSIGSIECETAEMYDEILKQGWVEVKCNQPE